VSAEVLVRSGGRPSGDSSPPPGDDLERLIVAEERIATRAADAAAEARALVASAHARAEQAERQAREEVRQAMAELEREMALDRERQLQAVAQELDRELRELQAIPEERITQLARKVLGLLLQSGSMDPSE
jgi:hypothetical protein